MKILTVKNGFDARLYFHFIFRISILFFESVRPSRNGDF